MPDYIVKEEDGSSRIILEEGDGFLLLEESSVVLELGPDECGLSLGAAIQLEDASGSLELEGGGYIELEADPGLIVLGDGSGVLLLEQCAPVGKPPTGFVHHIQRLPSLEDEEAIATVLAIAAARAKRRRRVKTPA